MTFNPVMPRVDPTNAVEFPTVPGTSKRAGIGPKTIRGAIRRGELPAYVSADGKGWPRVYWPEFVAWMRSRRIKGTDPAHRRVSRGDVPNEHDVRDVRAHRDPGEAE